MGNSNAVFIYMALLLMEGSAGMVMIMQQKRSENIYSFPSYGMMPRFHSQGFGTYLDMG